MSTELTKKDISIIAFEMAIKAAAITPKAIQKDDPIFIDEACNITGYSQATIYSLINKKQIPFYKTAGRRRLHFLKSELLSWMAGNEIINPEKEVIHHG